MRLTDQVLRAIRWDSAGALVTSAITFLTTVWLVRMLGPESYGILAALLAFLGLVQLFASGGIRYLLLRFVPGVARGEGPDAVNRLVWSAVKSRTVLLTLVSLPLAVAPETVAAVFLGRAELAPYVQLVPLLLAPLLFADLLKAVLIALFRQPIVRLSELFNKAAFALGLLTVPLWRDPLVGVFGAWTAGWLVGIVVMIAVALRQGLFHRPTGGSGWGDRRWLSFSSAAYGLSIIGYVLGRELDVLLLTRLGIDNEMLAQYAVCFSFVALVFRLPVLPIAGGFDLPLIASLYGREDWVGLRRLFRAYFEYIYTFILPIVGGGLILGPALVARIYGAHYGDASNILFPLLVMLGLTKLGGITGPFLMASDREKQMLRIRLTMSAVNVVAALVAIPKFGAQGAAWATGGTMVGLVVWEATVVQRFLKPRYPWRFLASVFLATGVMMLFLQVVGAGMGDDVGLVRLFAVVGGGGACYTLMLLWFRPLSAEHGDMLEGIGVPGLAKLVRRMGRPKINTNNAMRSDV